MKKYLALGLAALLAIGATIVPDEYDKLFLRMDGTTTTFVDSSTANPKSITANGNAKQLPIKFNKSAGFFNGTTDYVVVPDSADWHFAEGNFTIEVFLSPDSVSGTKRIINQYVNASNRWTFYQSGKKLVFYAKETAGVIAYYTTTDDVLDVGWHHVALVRDGEDILIYVDGTSVSLTTTTAIGSSSLPDLAGNLYIGAENATENFTGWMKELRISNVARTVAVPTTQYTSDANTKLLMHFDTPANSPLGPAIYFDGTGDYLTVPDSADWTFSGNHTIEFFFRPTVDPVSQNIGLFSHHTDVQNFMEVKVNTNEVYWTIYVSNTDILGNFHCTASLALNKWSHLAFVRSGNDWTIYQDGRQIGTKSATISYPNFNDPFSIGKNPSYIITGFLREFRISDSARYSTSFAPSQTGFTVDSNTKLYIKGDENNGVTTFVDSETSPKTVTTNGDTKIKYTEDYRSCIFVDSETTAKFPYSVGSAKVDFFAIGSGVGYFDGASGTSVSVADSADWDFGTSDFTLEGYFRIKTKGTNPIIQRGNSNDISLQASGSGADPIVPLWRIGNSTIHTSSEQCQLNTWYHLSVSRSGTASKLFLNGTVVDSDANSSDITYTTDLYIGNFPAGSDPFIGLLDNIRISKGVARYTATFNPPDDYSAPRVGKRKTNWFFFF